jgi:hypothetical protein
VRIFRFEIDVDPPYSPLEKAVFAVAAIPALIAGYLYGLHLIGIAQ